MLYKSISSTKPYTRSNKSTKSNDFTYEYTDKFKRRSTTIHANDVPAFISSSCHDTNINPTQELNKNSTHSLNMSNAQLIEIFCLNVQGIRPECVNTKVKIPFIRDEIQSNTKFTPFFALIETHLNKDHFDAEISIENYTVYRSDRKDRKGGGVALYIHNSLIVNSIERYSDGMCESVIVFLKDANLYISVTYRPPKANEMSFKNCINTVKAFTNTNPGVEHMMLGDFNFRTINWKNESITSCPITISERNQARYFLEYTDENLLIQMVQENTRKDAILDLVLTTNIDIIHNIKIEKTSLSDHNFVKVSIVYPELQKEKDNTPITMQTKKPLDKLDLHKADWPKINDDLRKVDWDSILENKSVEQMLSVFEEEVNTACIKHCPERQFGGRNRIYIPKERRGLLRKKKKLNGRINYYTYVNVVNTSEKLKKVEREKEKVEEEIRSSHKAEMERKELEVISKIVKNPKVFYSYAKKRKKTVSKIGPLSDKNKIYSEAKMKADILQRQYCTVFSDPKNISTQNIPDNYDETKPTINDITFTVEDIKKAIDDIPTFSAPGPDKIPAILLKKCKDELAHPLYMLWRLSLDTGNIPEILKTQGIIPIYKKGDKSDAANYRPVSLTSHIIKLFGRVVRSNIVKFIEEQILLADEQHGFRPSRSTVTQLLVHIDNILDILETAENADVIYLDFAKAFDKVDHKLLLKKIRNLGIGGRLLNWIENFLTNRKQHVIVDGEISQTAPVTSGVPQGTVLGPVLFIIFIDDLTKAIEYSNLNIFADDSKLTLKIKSDNDHINLQKDLHSSIIWALLNNMALNTDKFQLLQHGPNNHLKRPYEITNNQSLSNSESVKDLGLRVSADLDWEEQFTNMVKEGKKFTGWILRCFQSRSPEIILPLFKMFVIPRLEYACLVYMPYKNKDIVRLEGLQRTLTSRLDNLRGQNYHQRLKSLKLYSLQRRRERYAIVMMWKMAIGLTKNFLNLEFYNTQRFGMKCHIKLAKTSAPRHVQTLRNNYFTAVGPSLFNCIPGSVKCKDKLQTFKSALDRYLQNIPDLPPIPGYNFPNKNSIVDWVHGGAVLPATS